MHNTCLFVTWVTKWHRSHSRRVLAGLQKHRTAHHEHTQPWGGLPAPSAP